MEHLVANGESEQQYRKSNKSIFRVRSHVHILGTLFSLVQKHPFLVVHEAIELASARASALEIDLVSALEFELVSAPE